MHLFHLEESPSCPELRRAVWREVRYPAHTYHDERVHGQRVVNGVPQQAPGGESHDLGKGRQVRNRTWTIRGTQPGSGVTASDDRTQLSASLSALGPAHCQSAGIH